MRLDRGELDKIIERAGAELAPAPQAAPQAAPQPWGSGAGAGGLADVARDMLRGGGSTQHYGERGGYDPRYGHKKRKKSFLESMFD